MKSVIVGITGASGAAYAYRLVEVLLQNECQVRFSITPTGCEIFRQELGLTIDPVHFDLEQTPAWKDFGAQLVFSPYNDYNSPVASGSVQNGGMVVCPCTGGSLGAIANGFNQNVIHRAAEVQLKERRKLILVVRETPLSLIHLENMTRVTKAGGIILPACPGFYAPLNFPLQEQERRQKQGRSLPFTLDSIIDFVVNRICQQLDVRLTVKSQEGEPPFVPIIDNYTSST